MLSGNTSEFSLYPKNHYEFFKKNEDFGMSETLKDLRFQEFLLDDEFLFDDFLGSIVGDADSSHNTLGKKVYEKISNFVENIADVDRNEIAALLSQMEMLNVNKNVYNSSLVRYPELIKRILNMASISKNKIVGSNNKFSDNFDIRGASSKELFGTNIGDQINTDTYIISAGQDLVALEKFSGNYTRMNTFQPISALSATSYQLSSYSDTWGWPLVLPSPITYEDIEKYYTFFEYVSGYEGSIKDYSIDFANTGTTILSSATSDDLFNGGIFENMIIDRFTSILKLDQS
jgi:hypothetical protein